MLWALVASHTCTAGPLRSFFPNSKRVFKHFSTGAESGFAMEVNRQKEKQTFYGRQQNFATCFFNNFTFLILSPYKLINEDT